MSPQLASFHALPSDFSRKQWQRERAGDVPIHSLVFPGTHHAAMVTADPETPERWFCQTKDVYTQLCDGIRFLDVRVQSTPTGDGVEFFGHHETVRGNSLDGEVFPQIRRYLQEIDRADGSECLILKLSHFRAEAEEYTRAGGFDDSRWGALSALLSEMFDEYVIDLGAWKPRTLLNTSITELDGPRVAILYRTITDHPRPPSLPAFTAKFSNWVSSVYPDTATPGAVLANGVRTRHPKSHQLGETQWIIRKPTDLYTGAKQTNATLPLYHDAVKVTPQLAPNIVRVDFYDQSEIVSRCVELSEYDQGVIPSFNPAGRCEIRAPEDGRYLTVAETDGRNDAVLEMAPPHVDAPTQFSIERTGDGTYSISVVGERNVLTAECPTPSDTPQLAVREPLGTKTQQWYPLPRSKTEYCVLNAQTGMALGADPRDQSTGPQLDYWTNSPDQYWRIDTRHDTGE